MQEHSFILETEAVEYLRRFNIPYPDHALAATADDAAAAAAKIGFPVVLKIVSPQVVHKSEAGGVAVGLKTEDEVKAAAAKIFENVRAHVPGADIKGLLVCSQAGSGVEVIVGGLRDGIFGPAVMVGLGGIFTEILKDVAFRVYPLSEDDALAMLKDLKGYPLLDGARGRLPIDQKALAKLIVAVAKLMNDCPEVTELDLNPVIAYPDRILPVDARISVKQPE
ncbi:acetate--CoA ligase family protein [Deltaproteobacteria bacterium OttesenSCG-928-K17]|nr:acetate--CoA ligase family protein [Deltaproteobacteria bacterium OttesenSCG-928-K17]